MSEQESSQGAAGTVPLLPSHINSLDAKILQYIYSISKLQCLIESLRKLEQVKVPEKVVPIVSREPEVQEKAVPESAVPEHADGTDVNAGSNAKVDVSNGVVATLPTLSEASTPKSSPKISSDTLHLVNYIIPLTGTIFSISENAFNQRLNLLSNFKLFKQAPIVISPMVTHVSYDSQDTSTPPLLDLPSASISSKCLKLLLSLCLVCLGGYTKRLEMAKLEKAKYETIPTEYYTILEKIVKEDVFNTNDIDLSLSDLTFPIPRDEVLLSNETFVEACLVDIDIKMIPLITNNLLCTLESLKISISRFKNLKQNQNKKSIPNFDYSLHKIFILTLRLNDIYTIFRKFGRKIYLSNTEHLTDQKFLFQTRNPTYFRSHILAQMEDVFNSTKKNGPLIATLTRFIRQTANFEVSIKNILDFINFINQTYLLLETSLQKFDEFGVNWTVSEMRFRKVYQLPRKNLVDIYQFNNELKLKLFDIPLPAKPTPQTNEMPDIKTSELDSPTKNRSRSSSVSSILSNSSATLGRKTSTKRNSLVIPPLVLNQTSVPIPTPSPNRSRSSSLLFLNQNSSLSNFEAKSGDGTAAAGRRRSNSQPIKLDQEVIANFTTLSVSPGPSINRSPTGSITRSPLAKRNGVSPAASPTRTQLPISLSKQLLAVAEEDGELPKRSAALFAAAAAISKKQPLTANQRFQQHVRHSAKLGALMTQEKETFTSVIFDPNTPSNYGLRKDPATTPVAEPSRPAAPEPAKVTKPRVVSERDRDTRRNTQRNTGTTNVDAESGGSNNTFESTTTASTVSSNGNVSKRVRFIGVPEYTPAEDKPPKYANKILNRFAMFSNPTLSKSVYKKRDELLVQEGLEFKQQVHAGEAPVLKPPPTLPGLAAAQDSRNKLK